MQPPDLNLGRFLTRLSVEPELRQAFDADPAATLDGLDPPLRASVRQAILDHNRALVFDLLNIANQSSGGKAPKVKKAAKKRAKATRKVARAKKTLPRKKTARKSKR
jgi:hypothetical protein